MYPPTCKNAFFGSAVFHSPNSRGGMGAPRCMSKATFCHTHNKLFFPSCHITSGVEKKKKEKRKTKKQKTKREKTITPTPAPGRSARTNTCFFFGTPPPLIRPVNYKKNHEKLQDKPRKESVQLLWFPAKS